MKLVWSLAGEDELDDIAELRNATADALTAAHGSGPWSGHCTSRGVRADLRDAMLLAGSASDRLLVTLRLATRKPWAIDRTYFTLVKRPLYLTSMAVAPDVQRRGLGRQALERARQLATEWPADAIWLDAFDHPAAGAGGFYARCGYREVGRITYRGAPLVYFELPLEPRPVLRRRA